MSYVFADLLEVTSMLWMGVLVPTVVFFIFFVMPETPEFLVKEGKVDVSDLKMVFLKFK